MNLVEQLIEKIEKLQFTEDQGIFNSGMFPSIRSIQLLGYKRMDSNSYYPSILAFNLLELARKTDEKTQTRIHKIIDSIRSFYPNYKSSVNPYFYNFYKTNPSKHFEGGHLLSRFQHFKLPDDIDDTILIQLTLNDQNPTQDYIDKMKVEFSKFSNLKNKQIKTHLEKNKNLPAYAVWFGSGKMPIEFDICVFSNVLYYMFKNNSQLNEQDLASLKFIKQAIEDNDIVKHTYLMSYWYPDQSIIYYHIAKLCSIMDDPNNYFPIEKLIDQIEKKYASANSLIDQILLSTSLIRLGKHPKKLSYTLTELEKESKSYAFFRYPILYGMQTKLTDYLAKFGGLHMRFICPAHTFSLALEYEVLRNNNNRS